MSGPTTSPYRRVIMGLCHGATDAETMRTAAELAQLLGLNLRYLFIEDEACTCAGRAAVCARNPTAHAQLEFRSLLRLSRRTSAGRRPNAAV